MDFEKKLEQLRIEINSMSKKIIKLRASYKSLKKIYLQEISKSAPVKKIRKNYYVSKIKAERLKNLERLIRDKSSKK